MSEVIEAGEWDEDDWDDDDAFAEPEDEGPELAYPSVDAFVTQLLAPLIRRRVNGSLATWCPTWWRHAEAISRLNALWRAFEAMRLDPGTGLSDWWLHHADPHLDRLTDPDMGTFAACHPIEGHTARPLAPLPVEPSPPQMWESPVFGDLTGAADMTPAARGIGTDG